MVLVYHGTSVRQGIKIAMTGAILSPLEMRIRLFRQANPERLASAFPGKTLEEAAIESISFAYGEHEIDHRVKSVSVVNEIEHAVHYAMMYEIRLKDFEKKDVSGGLILAVDIDSTCFDRLVVPTAKYIRYIPDRLSIDSLKEIHLSPMARRNSETTLREAFSKCNPIYKYIEK